MTVHHTTSNVRPIETQGQHIGIDTGGEYVLTLKDKQATLAEDLSPHFADELTDDISATAEHEQPPIDYTTRA